MNDTTVIGGGQQEDVRASVWAVRAWLADLPADEVEDLTAGMEADLAERAAESGGGTLGALLGEPEAYAAELRSAAGLPPRAVTVVADAVAREPWTARLVRGSHDGSDAKDSRTGDDQEPTNGPSTLNEGPRTARTC